MNLARLRQLWRRTLELYRTNGIGATALKIGQWLVARLISEGGAYRLWRLLHCRLSAADRHAIALHVARMPAPPVISVVMPVYNPPPAFLKRALDSVIGQLYPHWQLCIADDASTDPAVVRLLERYAAREPRIVLHRRARNGHIAAATNTALELAKGEFVAFMDHDDALSDLALYMVAAEVEAHPAAGLIYSDEDKINPRGRYCSPFFKPDWNEDQLLAQNYVNHLTVMRRELVAALGGCRLGFEGSQDHDLVIRAAERLEPEQIRHIPMVLYHWRMVATSFSETAAATASEAALRAVREHFLRGGRVAEVGPAPGAPHHIRVRYPLPEPPPVVSVIVPTRDRVELLRPCIDGLLDETDYPALDIIVVDNGSEQAETHAYFQAIAERGVRVLRYDAPFNYSAINNFAARQARGSYLCLLNNDIKVRHADWLAEMVAQAARPEVGAVGAKLFYPDGTIQHAGVVTGIGGVAGHLYQHLPGSANGNYDDLRVVRQASCVTAACLVMRKEIYDAVGGLDETAFAVAFNDVDLCLRIRAKGYRVVWTPHAELWHFESATRGSDEAADKIDRFRQEQRNMYDRWGADTLARDPFFNPNRAVDRCNPGLSFPPRVPKPWRR